jgi:hypothetical protein
VRGGGEVVDELVLPVLDVALAGALRVAPDAFDRVDLDQLMLVTPGEDE